MCGKPWNFAISEKNSEALNMLINRINYLKYSQSYIVHILKIILQCPVGVLMDTLAGLSTRIPLLVFKDESPWHLGSAL